MRSLTNKKLSKFLVLGIICLSKLVLFLEIYFTQHKILAALQNWDSEHYLKIARSGYTFGLVDTNAFFPLFPFLIRLLHKISGVSFPTTGILLANISSCLGLLIFYGWVERRASTRIAILSLLAVILQPGAIFFSLIYSEGVFFLLLMIFIWGMETNNRGLLPKISAFALPLTRAVGFLVILAPLGTMIYEWRTKRKIDLSRMFICVSICLGLLSYFLIMKQYSGEFMGGIKAQELFIFQASFRRFLEPVAFLLSFIRASELFSFQDGILDRFYAVLFLGSLWQIFRKKKADLLYALPLGLLPLVCLRFSSFLRFIMVVPPIFPALIRYLDETRFKRWILFLFLCASILLQLIAILRFCHGDWVA